MQCPRCASLLEHKVINNIAFYRCVSCLGAWVPKGKWDLLLKLFVEQVQEAEYKPDHLEPKERVERLYYKEKPLICPFCNIDMKKFYYAYDSNVVIDRCPSCSGIYADKGEIKAISLYLKGSKKQEALAQKILEDIRDKRRVRREVEDLRLTTLSMLAGLSLPLTDENPTLERPFVTISIIALNFFIFLFTSLFVKDILRYFYTYGMVPSLVIKGKALFTLITHLFTHGGWLHLLGNMLFFWIFADNLEDRLGHAKFILLFFIYGILASLGHLALNSSSSVPMVGSSGAIAGIMGSYLVFWPKAKLKVLTFRRITRIPAGYYLIGWFILQIILAAYYEIISISWQAHISGFILGIVVAWQLKKRE